MNELERYLAEEIALDFRDGHISRRDASHRLAAMGVGAAATATMLACGGEAPSHATSSPASASGAGASAATRTRSGSPTASASVRPLVDLPPSAPTEATTFAGPEGRKLQGAWAAAAERPKGAVMVIHENKGLNDHTRHVAGRFAEAGYSALAIDLLSAEGGTVAFADPAEATAALGKA